MSIGEDKHLVTVERPSSIFDSLPPLEGAWPEGQPARRRAPRRGFDRREFIRRAVGTGMTLGLASLTVFPPARALAADPYDVYNACPTAVSGSCSPACGPSQVRQAACTSGGWHENTGCFYRSRNNQCYGGWADGWYWRVTGCSQCGSARSSFRCHDGKTCPDSCGNCYNTICRSFEGCS